MQLGLGTVAADGVVGGGVHVPAGEVVGFVVEGDGREGVVDALLVEEGEGGSVAPVVEVAAVVTGDIGEVGDVSGGETLV